MTGEQREMLDEERRVFDSIYGACSRMDAEIHELRGRVSRAFWLIFLLGVGMVLQGIGLMSLIR